MFVIALLSLLAIAAASSVIRDLPESEQEHVDAFEALRVAHSRQYAAGSTEYTERFGVFKQNVLRIRETMKTQKKAKFALNLFFDVSEEEFKAYRMKPFDVRDPAVKAKAKRSTLQKGTVVHDCLGGGAQKKRDVESLRQERAESKLIAAFPTSFDWRNHKPAVVSPVKNQAQCGSCWAFSTMETLESAWAIAGKGLPILGPQELVDCSTDCSTDPGSAQPVCDQGCDGGFPWAAVQSLIELGGADSEASYPYQGVDGTCAFTKAGVKAVPRNHTCISNAKQDGASASNADMMTELFHGQPLSICMDASEWQFYDSGVFTGDGCSETQLDHAIQVTGWGEESGIFWGKTLYWNVRNSWSSSWGESGYIRIERGTTGSTKNTCGILNAVMKIGV